MINYKLMRTRNRGFLITRSSRNMFTVKQIINNATSLYEEKEITVASPGSEQWRQAFDLADELEVQAPDIIEHIPMSYEDPEMTKPNSRTSQREPF